MNKTFIVISLIVVAALLYLLAPILTPFLAGAIIAYLGDPLVRRLMRFRIPRILSVIIVFSIIFLIIALIVLLLIPLIEKQIAILIAAIPGIVSWVQTDILPWLNKHFDIQESINIDTLKTSLAEHWTQADGVAAWAWKTVLRSGFALAGLLTTLVLIPVVTFYLLRDWDQVTKGIRKLLPRSIEPTVVKLVTECDDVLSAFFRGQLLVMLSLGVIYSVGLSMVGLQLGVMIGLISGLLSIVPYLGFIIGIVAASVAAYVQFNTLSAVGLVWVVYLVGQAIESSFLTPSLVGDRIGLHPVAVIFAVLTGGSLFGFFGVLLALPVAAVIMVLIRFLTARYQHSKMYK